MAHSNQVREFRITPGGIVLSDVYIGPGTVLTGSARVQQETRDEFENMTRQQEFRTRQLELEGNRKSLQAQMEALQAQLVTLTERKQMLQSQQDATEQMERLATTTLTQSRMSKLGHIPSGRSHKKQGKQK